MQRGFPGGSDGKESACMAVDPGSITGLGDPLEKGMATHSSILAQRIPHTEEPGGLQSTGSQRVRHKRATKYTHTHMQMQETNVQLPGDGANTVQQGCNTGIKWETGIDTYTWLYMKYIINY